MSKGSLTVALFAAGVLVGSNGAFAADLDYVTKAPPVAAPIAPAACAGFADFFVSNCILGAYGVQLYGAVDVGGGYQTHGAPFNGYFPQGQSYGIQKMNRQAEWGLAPGGLQQSNIGIKGAEPIAGDFQFIFQLEAGFDPYSLQLSDGGQSLFDNKGVKLNQQSANADSSRSGQFYNSVGFAGISSPTYGTLTVGRQNSLTLDAFAAYDPMALSYAFSLIGFSSTYTGAGATETARDTTAVKYRYQYGDFRTAVLYQFGGYDDNNGANGGVQAQLGGDIKHLGPGVLSLDGVYSYQKDVAALSLTGGGGSVIGAAPTAFTPQTLKATFSDNTSWTALAKYVAGPLKIYAGYEYIHYASPSDPAPASFQALDGTWITNGVNAVAFASTAYNGAPGSGTDKHLQVMWAGAGYNVTENVVVVGAYYHVIQDQFLVATKTANCIGTFGNQGNSACAGTQDAVSGLIDWKFAPKWDTYAGIMYSVVNGGLANGYLVRNNLDPTVGLRFRF